ncbi:hypothetical protein KFE25_002468 [Diacronema lutheri]|uniref:CS domain-containing protein n=2 Tax=Diacronema lutheri TaxID=2081491 RepID=A0A8J5X5V4_DIALT|nr:hypothetical protein KFE25_002468 [Diacronema lutheri]
MPIKYVLVPCDDSQPLSERVLDLPADVGEPSADVLKAALTPHFREGSVDPKAVAQQLGDLASTPGMDMSMLEQGTVETFPLTRPSEANGHAAVTLYLDECGVLKNKPRNERASRLAAECGHASPFHGDIFVAREQLLGPGRRHLADFTLADMSSSAKWMADAAVANYEHMVATKKMHAQMGSSFQHINLGDGEEGAGLPSGQTDAYSWTQTKSEVEIRVPLPSGAKARDCKVKFGGTSLSVAVAGAAAVLDSASLHDKVRPDECTWSVSGDGDERALIVTLEKASEGTWRELLAAQAR